MFSEHDPTIQDILQNSGAITPERLETLLNKREEEECSLSELVLSTESVPRSRFFHLIADFLGYDYLEEMPEEILSLIHI